MADRVHSRDSPPASDGQSAEASVNTTKPNNQVPHPPGTYVVQIPKDQVYRYPPPENAGRFQSLSRRKPRRSYCCRCLCWTLGLLILLVLLLAVAAAVLYIVFRPEAPKYSVDDVAIKGLNLSSSTPLSPEFDVTLRANNPKDNIGIYYEDGSSVNIYYSNVNLCNGALPVFYQPSNNVTVFNAALKGSGIVLANAVKSRLLTQQKQGKVSFGLKLEAPVKIKIGSFKTWKIIVKINCDLTVNGFTVQSKIISKDCGYGVKFW